MRKSALGVLCAMVVLSGCAGVGGPASSTPTSTPTPSPTQAATSTPTAAPCTPVGGKRLEAVPVNDTVNATSSESLAASEREAFLSMRNRTVKLQYPIPDLPRYVRHNGTTYEVVVVSLWDGCA
jgi:hypothetical protein